MYIHNMLFIQRMRISYSKYQFVLQNTPKIPTHFRTLPDVLKLSKIYSSFFILFYIYNLHNSDFADFVYFVPLYILYLIYIYIYIYTHVYTYTYTCRCRGVVVPWCRGVDDSVAQTCSPNKRIFRGPSDVVRGLDSVTTPKSVRGNWPLWSPWSPGASRGLPP